MHPWLYACVYIVNGQVTTSREEKATMECGKVLTTHTRSLYQLINQ